MGAQPSFRSCRRSSSDVVSTAAGITLLQVANPLFAISRLGGFLAIVVLVVLALAEGDSVALPIEAVEQIAGVTRGVERGLG